jgi:PD-(D/E)XK nuclease superfamily/Predicted AAA-ATPase
LLEQIRNWYNGFCFVEECERVYNPFSTLQLFNKQRFANYWFETGTPTFLVKLIREQNYDIHQLDELEVSELGFSTYELENLALIPLLFQTGYMTIQSYDRLRQLYKLYYPNYEVENAFLVYLLHEFSATPHGLSESYLWKMIDALQVNNLPQFFTVLDVLFANIPYSIQLAQEKYYQSIFVLIFKLIGLRVEAEAQTNAGRIDAVIEVDKHIYLFEFKFDKSAAEALQQIKDHAYAQKYRLLDKPITLVGANFASTERKISEWQAEPDKIPLAAAP